MAVAESHIVHFDEFELDTRTSELSRNGVRLKLQPQPIQLLLVLLQHPGELVTREELQQRLWPTHTFVDFEHGLNTAIKKLRQALGDEAESPHYIETLPRRGYRFIGTVTHETPETKEAPQLPTEFDSPIPVPVPVGAEVPSSRAPVISKASLRDGRRAKWVKRISIVLALCALGGIGEALYLSLRPPAPRVINAKQLTFTRKQKTPAYPCYLGTDGTRIYFQEHRLRDRWTLSEVSTQGGAQSDIAAPSMALPCPQGVSPSGSEMLVKDCCPFKLWSLPLPAGSARPVPYEGVIWAAWTPNGQELVYTTYAKGAFLYRGTIDGKTKQQIASAPSIDWVRVSPDGRLVRYTVKDGAEGAPPDIWEADVDGHNPPRLVFPEMKGETWMGDWTADGKLFFFHRRKGTSRGLWVVRENNDPLKFFRPHPTLLYAGPLELRSPVSSKDSKELYAIGLDLRGELSVLDPQTSKFVPFVDGVSGCFVTFSPDRQWVAYVSYPDGALWKSRVDGSEKMQLTFSPTGVINPRWSPDGKFIVFMDWYSGPNHVIYLISADGGGRPQLLATAQDQPADPTWMPDSNSIVYSGPSGALTKILILDLPTMRSTGIPGSEGLWSPRVSPDGKHIVALTNKRVGGDELMLYSFASRRWVPLGVGNGFGFPAWSHDSKYVYAYRNSEGKFSRVNINSGKLEVVANLDNVAWTAFRFRFSGWFDLTPDDRIMIMRDTGAEDIYSLQLEY